MGLVSNFYLLLVCQLFSSDLLRRRQGESWLDAWLVYAVEILVELAKEELDELIGVMLLISLQQPI